MKVVFTNDDLQISFDSLPKTHFECAKLWMTNGYDSWHDFNVHGKNVYSYMYWQYTVAVAPGCTPRFTHNFTTLRDNSWAVYLHLTLRKTFTPICDIFLQSENL